MHGVSEEDTANTVPEAVGTGPLELTSKVPQGNKFRKCCRHTKLKVSYSAKRSVDRGSWQTDSVMKGTSLRWTSSPETTRRRPSEAQATHKERRTREVWPRPGKGVNRNQGLPFLRARPVDSARLIPASEHVAPGRRFRGTEEFLAASCPFAAASEANTRHARICH